MREAVVCLVVGVRLLARLSHSWPKPCSLMFSNLVATIRKLKSLHCDYLPPWAVRA